ncbi:Cardiotrophin-like cytokine factor 1, partial [Dryobates pubescens]
GDSWGIFTFLCAALCNLPALPALNCSEELGTSQSLQKTYDLTRYLEHQLRTLAGTYVSRGGHPTPPLPPGTRGLPYHDSPCPSPLGDAQERPRLGHFCPSLQGLVLSIAGVMSSLGYPLPAGPVGPPAPPGTPVAPNDFLKKMDDFWLLKELQTWLWRSAKDFNRLKKKVPPSVVTLRLEARGF